MFMHYSQYFGLKFRKSHIYGTHGVSWSKDVHLLGSGNAEIFANILWLKIITGTGVALGEGICQMP